MPRFLTLTALVLVIGGMLGAADCTFIGTFCRRCGSAYWTFLDSARMSKPEEVFGTTKTKRCDEAELHDIAYEWVMRAYHLGIPKNAVEITISSIEVLS